MGEYTRLGAEMTLGHPGSFFAKITHSIKGRMEQIKDITRTDLGKLDKYARLLDSSIRIPSTQHSFGLDPLLGLIP